MNFAVKKLAADDPPPHSALQNEIEFSCPKCRKDFRESIQAAGKRTRCPKCETEFTIPQQTAATSPPQVPQAKAESAVDRAVAAYQGGKPEAAPTNVSTGRRRFLNRNSIIPIGFLLILLGGTLTTVGAFLAAKSLMGQLSLGSLNGQIKGQDGQGVLEQQKAYARLIQQLTQEANDGRLKGDPVKEFENNWQGRNLQDLKNDHHSANENSSSSSLLIWGAIAGGAGSLMTLIGCIFLLAGLISRFMEPKVIREK
ncbi:MAG: hypothetical protein Tsb009_34330 [Planctomycetaceae bacterium]